MMRYFDFEKCAREAKIPPDKLEVLSKTIRREFPNDDMLFELHLMRVCSAIRDGHLTLAQAMNPEQAA